MPQKAESIAGKGLLPKEALHKSSPIETGNLQVDGPIVIGRMNLYVLVTGHDRGTWDAKGDEIENFMKQFPIVIPEYRPSEYQQLENDQNFLVRSQMSAYREANYLFVEIERICDEQKKDVWVPDPAHDFDFAKLRGVLLGSEVATEEALALGTLHALNETVITRGSFLTVAGIAAFLAPIVAAYRGYQGNETGFADLYIERDLRNVVVADFLVSLSKNHDFLGGDTLLIYPKYHWFQAPFDSPSIKTYLMDANRRTTRLNLYRQLLSDKFPTFFQPRHYTK